MKVWKNLISFVIPKERCEGVNEKARKICDSKLYYARKAGRWCLQLRRIDSGDISTEAIIEHLVKKLLHFPQEARKLFHQPSYLQNQSAYSQFLLALSSHFCASARVFWCAAHYFLLTTGAPVGPRGVTGLPPEFMPWYWYLAFFSLGFRIWNDSSLLEILHHLSLLWDGLCTIFKAD